MQHRTAGIQMRYAVKPASKASYTCAVVASEWPTLAIMPRLCRRSPSSSAPGSSQAMDQRRKQGPAQNTLVFRRIRQADDRLILRAPLLLRKNRALPDGRRPASATAEAAPPFAAWPRIYEGSPACPPALCWTPWPALWWCLRPGGPAWPEQRQPLPHPGNRPRAPVDVQVYKARREILSFCVDHSGKRLLRRNAAPICCDFSLPAD